MCVVVRLWIILRLVGCVHRTGAPQWEWRGRFAHLPLPPRKRTPVPCGLDAASAWVSHAAWQPRRRRERARIHGSAAEFQTARPFVLASRRCPGARGRGRCASLRSRPSLVPLARCARYDFLEGTCSSFSYRPPYCLLSLVVRDRGTSITRVDTQNRSKGPGSNEAWCGSPQPH